MGFFDDFLSGQQPQGGTWHFDRSQNNQFYDQFFSNLARQDKRYQRLIKNRWGKVRKRAKTFKRKALSDLKQDKRNLAREYRRQDAESQQSLMNRGLGNTTTFDAANRGNREVYNRAREDLRSRGMDIRDRFAHTMAGVEAQKPIAANASPYYRLMQQMAQTGQLSGQPPQRQGGLMSAFNPAQLGSNLGQAVLPQSLRGGGMGGGFDPQMIMQFLNQFGGGGGGGGGMPFGANPLPGQQRLMAGGQGMFM